MPVHDKEYHKNYYNDNKDRLGEKRREYCLCECGCEITRGGKSAHKRSKKHILRMIDVNIMRENKLYRIQHKIE